jgi:hypothetical protein
MKHQDQLKFGTTTTLDEPVSETIVILQFSISFIFLNPFFLK